MPPQSAYNATIMKEGMPLPIPKGFTEIEIETIRRNMEDDAKARSREKYTPKFTREDAINRIVRDQAIVDRQADAALEEARANIGKKEVGDMNH